MITSIDILNKIRSDFGEGAEEAYRILDEAIANCEYLNHDRIIRCVLFLAEKSLEGLKQRINVAMEDTRDVILWAEYTNLEDGKEPKRIRNFNNPFESSEMI